MQEGLVDANTGNIIDKSSGQAMKLSSAVQEIVKSSTGEYNLEEAKHSGIFNAITGIVTDPTTGKDISLEVAFRIDRWQGVVLLMDMDKVEWF